MPKWQLPIVSGTSDDLVTVLAISLLDDVFKKGYWDDFYISPVHPLIP